MGMRHQVAVSKLRARRVSKQTKSRGIETGEQACLAKALMQEDISPASLTADTAVSIACRSTHAGRKRRHAKPFAGRNELSDLLLPMAANADHHHQQRTVGRGTGGAIQQVFVGRITAQRPAQEFPLGQSPSRAD